MINKDFVPYEESLELKELGFDEPCFGRFYYKDVYPMLRPNSDEKELFYGFGQFVRQTEETTLSPTYSQAFRWFREKYGLASQFNYYHVPKWTYSILEFTDIKITPNQIVSEYSKERTYEEAELACLRKLIEIVKQKV